MFSIRHEKFGNLTQIVLKNENSHEWFSFIPDFSASINGLGLKKNGRIHELVNGCATYDDMMGLGREKFKGSKLFPFPNRIKDGKYSFEGIDYQLPINYPGEGHAIHGLVLEKHFDVLKEQCTTAEARVTIRYSYDGSITGYPFLYALQIEFILNNEGICCTTRIENTDTRKIPVADGWHPYFTLQGSLDNFLLKLPEVQLVEVDSRMIPTGRLLPFTKYNMPSKINAEAFDTCFQLQEVEGRAELVLTNPDKDISLVMWQETGPEKYNCIQIYTPPSRDFIAIEPMTCQPDVFNNHQGLILLPPGETIDVTFGIQLR
jgi:aldose 1-epimerase